jgi:hypothetical protein
MKQNVRGNVCLMLICYPIRTDRYGAAINKNKKGDSKTPLDGFLKSRDDIGRKYWLSVPDQPKSVFFLSGTLTQWQKK